MQVPCWRMGWLSVYCSFALWALHVVCKYACYIHFMGHWPSIHPQAANNSLVITEWYKHTVACWVSWDRKANASSSLPASSGQGQGQRQRQGEGQGLWVCNSSLALSYCMCPAYRVQYCQYEKISLGYIRLCNSAGTGQDQAEGASGMQSQSKHPVQCCFILCICCLLLLTFLCFSFCSCIIHIASLLCRDWLAPSTAFLMKDCYKFARMSAETGQDQAEGASGIQSQLKHSVQCCFILDHSAAFSSRLFLCFFFCLSYM